MGIYANPRNANFKEAVSSQIYVDKTLLLAYTNEVIGTAQKAMCVSRPRRFGKSTTADMLAAYYGKDCDSKEIFKNLKIASCDGFEKNLNQYDLIYADINNFRHRMDTKTGKSITAVEAVRLLHTEIIRELKIYFPKSVTNQDEDLPTVLDFEEAKYWYDGYVFGDKVHVYNPKSVVDSIRRKKFTVTGHVQNPMNH